eukprot:Cvel_29589.t1-p1 / transcript=Cvel_29589.t1 / gene=Cvel_29589 / organism=Chromera_velia_CCMP2878 / gene_product=hypothetical protein / transcript_product=hypothetical protein / location=Cvel_scaffold4076:1401-5892(-) / protein_length=149 / sequence_SO=supercontig / SO=protein_coding / is_pseudo=false
MWNTVGVLRKEKNDLSIELKPERSRLSARACRRGLGYTQLRHKLRSSLCMMKESGKLERGGIFLSHNEFMQRSAPSRRDLSRETGSRLLLAALGVPAVSSLLGEEPAFAQTTGEGSGPPSAVVTLERPPKPDLSEFRVGTKDYKRDTLK